MRFLLGLLICSATIAAEPASRPRDIAPGDPPVMPTIGQVVDSARPAYVPRFTSVTTTSARQAEREWAYRFTYPSDPWYGCCGYGYGFGGGYPFFHGWHWRANHGFHY